MMLAFLIFSAVRFDCSDLWFPPPPAVTARTDSALYGSGQKIALTVTNHGTASIYLPNCCSFLSCYIERLEKNNWQVYQARGIPCLMMCPSLLLILQTGQSRTDSLTIESPGTYRVRVLYGRSLDNMMAEEVLSTQFGVRGR
jgi:hypothetical protein